MRCPLSTRCPGSQCLKQRIEQDTAVQQKRISLLEGKVKQQYTYRPGSGLSESKVAQRLKGSEAKPGDFYPYLRWVVLFLEEWAFLVDNYD